MRPNVYGTAKVTPEQVRGIRLAYDIGVDPIKKIAEDFNLAMSTVWKIGARKSWTNVSYQNDYDRLVVEGRERALLIQDATRSMEMKQRVEALEHKDAKMILDFLKSQKGSYQESRLHSLYSDVRPYPYLSFEEVIEYLERLGVIRKQILGNALYISLTGEYYDYDEK